MDDSGSYFHLCNKGVENRQIFSDHEDYEVFLKYIREYVTLPQDRGSLKTTFEINGHSYEGVPHLPKNYFGSVELVAYNLNPRHFHLLLKENTPGSVGKFMRSFCTRYAIYYNRKYAHVGGLFQGTYQSRTIKDLSQLKSLTYYIHHRGERSSILAYTSDQDVHGVSVDAMMAAFGMNKQQYKEYINSEALHQEDADNLQSVLIPCLIDHLAKKNLTRGDSPHVPKVLGNKHRNAFLTIALFGFLLLTGVSTRNIVIQRQASSATATVSQITEPTIIPTTQILYTSEQTESSVLSAEDASPVTLGSVQVRITGQASRVNIRSNPLPDAQIIAKAYDGDIFEAIEIVDNWYAIKLPGGTIGYILSGNVVILEQ